MRDGRDKCEVAVAVDGQVVAAIVLEDNAAVCAEQTDDLAADGVKHGGANDLDGSAIGCRVRAGACGDRAVLGWIARLRQNRDVVATTARQESRKMERTVG